MHNAVMCTLSLYDVTGITRHLHIKLKSFSNIAQPLHKDAVRGCSFLYIIAKKSVIMSEAFLVDVSISVWWHRKKYRNHSCESFCYAKGNFNKSARLRVQSKRLYFLFAFCARHYPWWSLWQKNTKNNYFIHVNPLFLAAEISNTVTVWRNARLTSY